MGKKVQENTLQVKLGFNLKELLLFICNFQTEL